MAEDFFEGGELLGLVVDDEILFITEAIDEFAQDADAKGMECAQCWAGRFFGFVGGTVARNELIDALLHFARGLVGESDGENIFRRDIALDEVSDAKGDDAGFAGAGPGQDEERTLNGFDGLTLLRV